MKNEGDNAVDINSLSENVLLVSRGCFQKMAPNLSCSTSSLMCGEFFTVTWRGRSSILSLCWITVSLKNSLLGNYFPLNKHCVQLTCIYPKCIDSGGTQPLFSSLHLFFFPKAPFSATLCIFLSENSGITGMWQAWISADWLDCLLLYLRLH